MVADPGSGLDGALESEQDVQGAAVRSVQMEERQARGANWLDFGDAAAGYLDHENLLPP